MLKRPSRSAGFVAVGLMGALVLSSCSSSPSEGGNASTTEFSFTFNTSNNLESPFETLAKKYMETNKDVKIVLNPLPNDRYGETLRTQLQAGNSADVIQTGSGSGQTQSVIPLAKAGYLEPLGASAAKLVQPGTESLFAIDGKTYGQPVDFSVIGMIANTTALSEAGVSEFPKDVEQMMQVCKTVSEKGKSFIALAGSVPMNTGLMAMSISASTVYAKVPDWNEKRAAGEVTFANTPEWKATLQTVIDMNSAGCFQKGVQGGGFDAITNNLARGSSIGAFAPSGSASEIAKAAEGQTIGVEAFPHPAGGKPFALGSSNYALSINAKSTKKDAAAKFLEWAAEPEQAKLVADVGGYLPVVGHDALDLSNTNYAAVQEIVKSGSYTPMPNSIWPNAAIYDELGKGVQGLLTGQRTVDQVLEAMDKAWS